MLKNKSLIAFFICCVLLLSATIYQQKLNDWGNNNEITWDAAGYYLYLPSLFYDHLSTLDKRQYIIDNYHPWADNIEAHTSPTGKYVIKYSSGQAFMFLPGFIVAHIWAKLGGYRLDGFSKPYQLCMCLYSVLFCCIGLWFIRKVLLIYFTDTIVALGLFTLCFTTNYLNFSTFSALMTHGYLFTVYSIIIYLSILWLKDFSYLKTILLGLLIGLAALTRPTEVISIFIPLAWGLSSFSSIKGRFNQLKRQWIKVLLLGFCAFLVGSIQLLYWKKMTGHFVFWSYGADEGFNFIRVHVYDCLFGYKKGWFVFTPVMILSVIGLIPLYFYKRNIFGPIAIFSFVAFYIVFSWKCWWYGGSFSQRAVVQYYTLLIFPICAVFEFAASRIVVKAIATIFCFFCTYLNLIMTYQANISGVMESDNMTKEYYWAIFGRPTVPVETKKLIYTDELLPARLKTSMQTIYTTDTLRGDAGFRDTIFEGKKFFVFDKGHHTIPAAVVQVRNVHSGWFRINANVAIRQWEGNAWKQPYIFAALLNEKGEQIKFKSYLIQRVIQNDHINQISIDIKVPDGANIKAIRGGLSNNDNDKLVLGGSVWVEYTPLN